MVASSLFLRQDAVAVHQLPKAEVRGSRADKLSGGALQRTRSSLVEAPSQSGLCAIDLFCGAGGMTEGLRQAGVRVVAGIDFDRSVQETYAKNHSPEARFVASDVRAANGEELLSWLPPEHCADDLVLVGCSPCQFWSRVPTEREKSRVGSTLLLEVGRLVEEVLPGYVVVENVPGLMKAGKERVLDPFLAGLAELGYVTAYDEVCSAWFGVPQRRPRFLLVASRLHETIDLPRYDRSRSLTVGDFLGEHNGFSRLRAGTADATDRWHRASRLSPDNLRRIRLTPHDGGDRSAWRDTPLQIDTYRGRDGMFRNVYGRMWWNRPAPTLTTRFNSLSNGRFGHPEEDRAISVREGATLQTFRRDYVFEGSLQSVCRQIGNAVPPRVAEAIGAHLVEMHRNLCASRPPVHPVWRQ